MRYDRARENCAGQPSASATTHLARQPWPPICLALLGWLAGAACSRTAPGGEESPRDPAGRDGAAQPRTAEQDEELANLPPPTKGSARENPAGIAWLPSPGTPSPEKISIARAEAKGYTVIDLSNGWVPYIFSEKTPGLEDKQPNDYRPRYIGLGNDQVDQWGDKLDEHEHNFLELYGIPPTLSVIAEEWDRIHTEVEPCLAEAGYDPSIFSEYTGTIAYSKSGENRRARKAAWLAREVEKAARKAKLSVDIQSKEGRSALASHRATASLYKRWREVQDEVDVVSQAQKRFRCEGLFNSDEGQGSFEPGVFDSATTHALANFERKHDIMGWGHFKADDLAMLAQSPAEAAHARLLRFIEERVVSAAGILEDGSAAKWKKSFTWKDSSGAEHPLPNLVREFTDAAIAQLGVADPATALEQLHRWKTLGEGNFDNLLLAVKLPPKPEYYGPNMAFDVVIDRGDVWYDFPYDAAGTKLLQKRSRYPHLTLYVTYLEQRIPLIHWRTTIGSWRNETSEGTVMLKYKNSDVGARVWKDIVAAPTWIPPATTPTEELIKGFWRHGKFRTDVNYPEIGPGYRSAYGLVAAYHIREIKDEQGNVTGEFDNSIRTHGSVDYMSILRRFSHGCHRLYNMDAVRMFSFILLHRDYTRLGQQPVGVRRELQLDDRSYLMKIRSRGYKYELVEPIEVMVTEGRIRGRRKRPYTEYVPKPVSPDALGEDEGTGTPGDGTGATSELWTAPATTTPVTR